MSRSYKKYPFVKDTTDATKFFKRAANKTIRRVKADDEIVDGKAYKKYYSSWNIHDYISRWPWEEAKKDWERNLGHFKTKYPTLKLFYRYWSKYYKRK